MISTFTSSKLSGVPSTMTITKPSVYMRITSRTTGVNLIYSDTRLSSAKTGRVAPSSPATKRAARDCSHASLVMAGKSNSSIP
jgi:hypothetical protein